VRTGGSALIEATCNQVNQHGGYTGQTPEAFRAYVAEIAGTVGLSMDRVILGGDHLGPFPWRRDRTAEEAMQAAAVLVREYVRAGFDKIHLDASMPLRGDSASPSDVASLAAERAAWLARVAEQAALEVGAPSLPRYVIGTEVPQPGGTDSNSQGLRITTATEVRATIEQTRQAFAVQGIPSAWERVLAVVVQPGVEFGDTGVHEYDPHKARELTRFILEYPALSYEAHSTDFQTRASLRQMVRDHFAILKVGPALTFAFREMAFALSAMEAELLRGRRQAEPSHLVEVLEAAMLRSPEHWQGHYIGPPEEQAFARKYSLSDRARYYWGDKDVQGALDLLIRNLRSTPLPLSLVSQFAPCHYARIRDGVLENSPIALLLDGVESVLLDYEYACQM